MNDRPPPSANPGSAAGAPARPVPENLWLNLGLNVAVPSLIMIKGPAWLGLGPVAALLVALVFPLGYGVYDLWKRRTWNALSAIGLAAILLTGGIGLLKIDTKWVAVKEAAVPLALGLAVTASLASRRPLVQALLLNPAVMDVAKIENAVAARGAQAGFRGLLRNATLLVAGSFLFSAVVNFLLARWLVHSPAGTAEFTAEIGRMTMLSWPVIALPSILIMAGALWYLLHGLHRLTGLEFEQLFHPEPDKKQIGSGTGGNKGNEGQT